MSDIIIRAYEMSDLDDLVEMFSMPKCQRETLQLPYQSHDDLRKTGGSQAGNRGAFQWRMPRPR